MQSNDKKERAARQPERSITYIAHNLERKFNSSTKKHETQEKYKCARKRRKGSQSSLHAVPWLCERHEATHHDVSQVLPQHGEVCDVHPGQRLQAQVCQRGLREPHPQALHERPPVSHRESNHNLSITRESRTVTRSFWSGVREVCMYVHVVRTCFMLLLGDHKRTLVLGCAGLLSVRLSTDTARGLQHVKRTYFEVHIYTHKHTKYVHMPPAKPFYLSNNDLGCMPALCRKQETLDNNRRTRSWKSCRQLTLDPRSGKQSEASSSASPNHTL